jgi:hypothetical protein
MAESGIGLSLVVPSGKDLARGVRDETIVL